MPKLQITNEQWALLDYLVKSNTPKNLINRFLDCELTLKSGEDTIDMTDIPVDCASIMVDFKKRKEEKCQL